MKKMKYTIEDHTGTFCAIGRKTSLSEDLIQGAIKQSARETNDRKRLEFIVSFLRSYLPTYCKVGRGGSHVWIKEHNNDHRSAIITL